MKLNKKKIFIRFEQWSMGLGKYVREQYDSIDIYIFTLPMVASSTTSSVV